MFGLLASSSGGAPAVLLVIYIAIIVVLIAGVWKLFEKAGQFGWAAIIPIYNYYVMLKVVKRPGWWLLLFLIPIVGFVIEIIVAIDIAKSFGKSGGYAVGIIFLPFIFLPMLGFGDAVYTPIQR